MSRSCWNYELVIMQMKIYSSVILTISSVNISVHNYLPAVTFRGHLYVYLCKKAEECEYEKDLAGRG